MTRSELLERAKPILFNTEMVRAIQDGTKTVTRRVLKPQPDEECIDEKHTHVSSRIRPKYKVGDILYVRETWAHISDWTDVDPEVGLFDGYIYRADLPDGEDHPNWHPSIHMPCEAARLFLRVTEARVERLQDITEEQAIAEGIRIGLGAEPYFSCKDAYFGLWNSTIKKSDLAKYGWAADPWVLVIEFERVEVTE